MITPACTASGQLGMSVSPSNWSSANSGDELWILQVLLDIATLFNPMQHNA